LKDAGGRCKQEGKGVGRLKGEEDEEDESALLTRFILFTLFTLFIFLILPLIKTASLAAA
jgi:hypothetical protein